VLGEHLVDERLGSPARRIADNWAFDASGMSLKSFFRVVRRSLAAARPPRTDEADFLGIVVASPAIDREPRTDR
jgi:hypothetical protein